MELRVGPVTNVDAVNRKIRPHFVNFIEFDLRVLDFTIAAGVREYGRIDLHAPQRGSRIKVDKLGPWSLLLFLRLSSSDVKGVAAHCHGRRTLFDFTGQAEFSRNSLLDVLRNESVDRRMANHFPETELNQKRSRCSKDVDAARVYSSERQNNSVLRLIADDFYRRLLLSC